LVISPAALLSLGRDLLREAERFEKLDRYAAILYRDGVLLLFLVCVPLRLRQFQSLRISDLQLAEMPGYVVCRRETLVGTHHSQFPLWPELQMPLDRYLRIYRPILNGQKSSDALWLSLRGTPLSRGSSAEALVRHTRGRFGIGLSTDHIRAIVANTILEECPDRFSHAATMLQLHGIEAFRKYADRAKAILAHQASARVQRSFG